MKKVGMCVILLLVNSVLAGNVYLPTGNGLAWDDASNWSLGYYPATAGEVAEIGVPTGFKKNKGWRNVHIDSHDVTVGTLNVMCGGATNRIDTGDSSGNLTFEGAGGASLNILDETGGGLLMIDLDAPNRVILKSSLSVNIDNHEGDRNYGALLCKGLWVGPGEIEKTGAGRMTLAINTPADGDAIPKIKIKAGIVGIVYPIHVGAITSDGTVWALANCSDTNEVRSSAIIVDEKVSADGVGLFVPSVSGVWYGGFCAKSKLSASEKCTVYVPNDLGDVRFAGGVYSVATNAIVSQIKLPDAGLTYQVTFAGAGDPEPVEDDRTAMERKLLETGLTLLSIDTENSVEPTCVPVYPPEGAVGLGITADKVKGSLTLRRGEQILFDSGAYKKNESGITVKVRGNTSALTPKKPYKIKLQKAADLLQRGGGALRTLSGCY